MTWLLLAVSLTTADFDAQVRSQCDRVAAKLTSINESALTADLVTSRNNSVERLKTVCATQSPLLRLYRLRPVFLNAENLSFLAAHQADSQNLERVQALWKSREKAFRAPSTPARGLAAQIAIAEEANNRAHKMFNASLPYAKAAGPFSGVYYVAEAEGNAAFAKFVASLPYDPQVARSEPHLDRATLRKALDALQSEAVTRFASDRSSNDMIGTSARLKEARELLDQDLLHGAALVLLEARLDLSRGDKRPAAANDAGSSTDSILALWDAAALENAELAVPIRRDVITLYKSLIGSHQ